LPTESSAKIWFIKCWIWWTPCSTLKSRSTMPHRSFGSKVTQWGKCLLTPSLFKIAWSAQHWILFSCLTVSVVRDWVCHRGIVGTAVENEGIHLHEVRKKQIRGIYISLLLEKCCLLSIVAIQSCTNP
jgi:hypothetical protein